MHRDFLGHATDLSNRLTRTSTSIGRLLFSLFGLVLALLLLFVLCFLICGIVQWCRRDQSFPDMWRGGLSGVGTRGSARDGGENANDQAERGAPEAAELPLRTPRMSLDTIVVRATQIREDQGDVVIDATITNTSKWLIQRGTIYVWAVDSGHNRMPHGQGIFLQDWEPKERIFFELRFSGVKRDDIHDFIIEIGELNTDKGVPVGDTYRVRFEKS